MPRLNPDGSIPPAKPPKRKRTPPPIYERPAPADRNQPGKTPTSGGGYHVPHQITNDLVRAKVAANAARAAEARRALVPDTIALARQHALRNAGWPVVTDGRWGPRSNAAWIAAGAKSGHETHFPVASVTTASLVTDWQGQLRASPHLLNDPEALLELHQLAGGSAAQRKAATAIARARGLTKGGLTANQAISRQAARVQLAAENAVERNRINQLRPGTYVDIDGGKQLRWNDLDELMLAKRGAHDVPHGLALLGGDQLRYILDHDGADGQPRRFTVIRPGENGPAPVPTEAFVKGLQGYANRHGQKLAIDGKLNGATVDALHRAAQVELDQRRAAAFRQANRFYNESGAFDAVMTKTGGVPMTRGRNVHWTFAETWARAMKKDRTAIAILSAANVVARERAAEHAYQVARKTILDQASLFGLTGGALPPDQYRSPFAGTPYGVNASTPVLMQRLLGVPESFAFGDTLQKFQLNQDYTRALANELAFKQARIDGSDVPAHIVFEHQRAKRLKTDANGNVVYRSEIHFTDNYQQKVLVKVPVYEDMTWVDQTQFHVVAEHQAPKPPTIAGFDPVAFINSNLLDPTLGTAWRRGVEPALGAADHLQWQIETQAVATALWTKEAFVDLANGNTRMNPLDASYLGSGSSPIYRQSDFPTAQDFERRAADTIHAWPWYLRASAAIATDPFNFAGFGAKGVGMFARGVRWWVRDDLLATAWAARAAERIEPARVAYQGVVDAYARSAMRVVVLGEPKFMGIRGLFRSAPLAKAATRENLDEAAAYLFKGMKSVPLHEQEAAELTDQPLRAFARSDDLLGPLHPVFEHYRADLFVDKAMKVFSRPAEQVFQLVMRAAEPGLIARLRAERPIEADLGEIPDYLFDVGRSGGSIPPWAVAIRLQWEAELRYIVRQTLFQPMSRDLRATGNYAFSKDGSFLHKITGEVKDIYLGHSPPMPEFDEQMRRIYSAQRGTPTTVPNPGHGIARTFDEMQTIVDYAVDTSVNTDIFSLRATALAAEKEISPEWEQQLREDLEVAARKKEMAAWDPPRMLNPEERADLDAWFDEQVQRSYQEWTQKEDHLRSTERELRRTEQQLTKLVIEAAQAEPHLAQKAEAAGGKVKASVVQTLADQGVVEQLDVATASRRAVETARSITAERVGEFDPRTITAVFSTKEQLESLSRVMLQLAAKRRDGIDPAFDYRNWWSDVARYHREIAPDVEVSHWLPPASTQERAFPNAPVPHFQTPKPRSVPSVAIYLHELAHTLQAFWKYRFDSRGAEFGDEVTTWLFARQAFTEIFPQASARELQLFDDQAVISLTTYLAGLYNPLEVGALLDGMARRFPEVTHWVDYLRSFMARYEDATTGLAGAEASADYKAIRQGRAAHEAEAQRQIAEHDAVGPLRKGKLDAELRKAFATTMVVDLAERGLFVSEETAEPLWRRLLNTSRHAELGDLVRGLPYKSTGVSEAMIELEGASYRLTDELLAHNALVDQHAPLDAIAAARARVDDAVDGEFLATDKVYSRILRMMDRFQVQDLIDDAKTALEDIENQLAAVDLRPGAKRDELRGARVVRIKQVEKLQNYLATHSVAGREGAELGRTLATLNRQQTALKIEARAARHAADAQRLELISRQRQRTASAGFGWRDNRKTVTLTRDPTVGTRASEVGKITDGHDALYWALNDPAFKVTQPPRPRLNLLDPKNYRENVWVDPAAYDRATGKYTGVVWTPTELDKEPAPDLIPLHQFIRRDEGRLTAIIVTEQGDPSLILRPGARRAFARDVTREEQATVGGVRSSERRRGMPPQLHDAIKTLYDTHTKNGGIPQDFDYQQITDLADQNPAHAHQIHQHASRRQAVVYRQAHAEAVNRAALSARPAALRQQALYLDALRMSQAWHAKVAYAAIMAPVALWKLAALPLSPAWLVANMVDNLTKPLLTGALTPGEFLAVNAKGIASLPLGLANASVPAIRYAALYIDRHMGTQVARALDRVLNMVTEAHAAVRTSLYDAHSIYYPKHLETSGLYTSLRNPLDPVHGDDPTDWASPLRAWQSDKGDIVKMGRAFHAMAWHMMGEAPEEWSRRQVFNAAFHRVMTRDADESLTDLTEILNREKRALQAGIEAVSKVLFDYNDVSVLTANLKPIFPFLAFTMKNTKFWLQLAYDRPWMVADLVRYEQYRADQHNNDPLARYADITAVVDPFFEWFGFDPLAPDGAGFDPVSLSSFKFMYKTFMAQRNANFAPEQGGSWFLNTVIGYLDQGGLGINPYLRAGLQDSDLFQTEAWRNIFPQTGLAEALTQKWWADSFPDGINLERKLQDPLYAPFHDGETLSQVRKRDIDYLVGVEMSRQAAAGLTPDVDRAQRDVRSFLGAAAIFAFVSGIWVRRLSEQDFYLTRIRQQARTDFAGMSPHQQSVFALTRVRGDGEEAQRRLAQAWPLIEAYYQTSNYRDRTKMLEAFPQIAPYVQHTASRDQFESPVREQAAQVKRKRDRALGAQSSLIHTLYGSLKDGGVPSKLRSTLYTTFMTPDLKQWLASHATPTSIADKFVQGEFYEYLHNVNNAFFDIPSTDYARKHTFMERNPWLHDYWRMIGAADRDVHGLLGSINASYREWYFAVKNAHGWDAAAPILEANPTMFDGTKSANHVDRYTGHWMQHGGPYSAHGISEHARDYLAVKSQLDAYFSLDKSSRDDYVRSHPAVLAYFQKWSHDAHNRRRFGSFRHHAFAAASNPFAARRAKFWAEFFQLKPDKRPAFIKAHGADAGIYAWGPAADSEFTAKAHQFSFGDTPRKAAYVSIKALMDLFFELPAADRPFFLRMNPELGAYFDSFSKASATGSKELDKQLDKFFKLPTKQLQQDYLDKHPGLEKFFKSKRTTPEEKAIGALLDAYFNLPHGAARRVYLARHPELQGFFDARRKQSDLEKTWLDALTDSDPRIQRFHHTLEYQMAVNEVHLRRNALYGPKLEGKATKLAPTGRQPRKPRESTARFERTPTS